MTAGLIVLIVLALFVFITAAAGVRIVPQARAGVVERLGRYSRTLEPGLTLIVPYIDRVKPLIDLREQVGDVPAAAGDHRGQPRGRHRHRHLLHGHGPARGDL